MKKLLTCLLVMILVLGLTSCSSVQKSGSSDAGDQNTDETASVLEPHKIAVLVYDRTDDEVLSFRKYLVDYLGEAFNVEFIYSEGSMSAEESAEFIKEAAEYGAEGVMSFITYDLPGEVALCEQYGIYYLVASGTVSNEVFAAVEDNPYFLGVIGPGDFIEYKAGSDMARHFLEKHPDQTEYFILSGGGCLGNEMHRLRTMGILDTLKNAYGYNAELDSEKMASSSEPVYFEKDDLKICVCPGYHTIDSYLDMAKKEYTSHPYGVVLTVLPATHILEEIKGAELATVDCYSENNLQLFTSGRLDYLVGKYSSIIGPSFAAMYNAITGYATEMRQNGKAFHITQGFWISDGEEDFEEKYVLANSIEINAYNYDDLLGVIKVFDPDASFDDLKTLTMAYTYKDAVERRLQRG